LQREEQGQRHFRLRLIQDVRRQGMRSRYIYAAIRWILSLGAIVMAYLYFNYAIFSAWQTAAPAGWERPDSWVYEAYSSFGRSLAFVLCAAIVALNVRPGWPRIRSRWNLFLIGVALAAVLLPPALRFLAIDDCLDAGGRWDYEFENCQFA
jgi:hypothetical protein